MTLDSPTTANNASAASRSTVTEEIYSSIAEVDVSAWEQVRLPDDIFLDLRLLRSLEISMADCCRFRFALYRDATGEAVAIAVLSTFTVDIGVLADDDWSRWALDRLRSISAKLVKYRILFCGLPLSACQSSLRFAPGANTPEIVTLLDQALRRSARADGARIIVLKEFADEELPPLQPLQNLGYRKADSLPTHVVPLRSESFDDYLQDVGKKRRMSIKRSIKKFAASGIQFLTTSDLPTIERLFTPAVYEMYEGVYNRSKTKLEHLTPAFFIELVRQLPDCCEFTFAMDGDKVRAFYISIWSGHEYRWLYMGYDESINEEVHLYFNLSFRAIADAARHGVTFAEIGQNSEYVKRTKLGATQSRRSFYVRGVRPFTNWAIGKLFHKLFPPRPLHSELKLESASEEDE
jgi:predicted N-acyltransferase